MPFPSSSSETDKNRVVCVLYGNYCFNWVLEQEDLVQECHCLPNCNDIIFTVNEQEVAIDPKKFCLERNEGKIVLNAKLAGGFNQLIYRYYKSAQMVAMNESETPSDAS
jgi:hypothetical protein